MSFAKLQIKAAATAFVLFVFASLCLFMLARGVSNVAAVLPLPKRLPVYLPSDTIGALLDLRPVTMLGAGVLLAVAVILVIRIPFLDRAVQMLLSMLTLLVASIIGIMTGYAGFVSINEHRLVLPAGVLPAAICFAVLVAVSFADIEGLRRSLLLRTLLVPVLAIAAPVLLIIVG
jgi:hypothetical protein